MANVIAERDPSVNGDYGRRARLLLLLPPFLLGLVYFHDESLKYFAFHYGTAGQAQVEGKWINPPSRYIPYKVQFGYLVGNTPETKVVTVSKDLYESLAKGQKVGIHYLSLFPQATVLDKEPPSFLVSFGFLIILFLFGVFIYFRSMKQRSKPGDSRG